ncbi:hypothetical protein [Devosia sp. 919]|uniref:hypothetical protein n=1 Tax=Devosia sp. 919 TaxID=2726065 RepID=UPI001553A6FE|nr:hypothetical protein [Devosia sp. 919]
MPRKVVIDTNLALLFAVGLTNRKYIEKHKRLATFDEKDFEVILELIDASAGLLLCPNVLSETSNLIRYIADPIRSEITTMFSRIIASSEETYIASHSVASGWDFARLGLTDMVLVALADGATLLTDDLDLYLAASSAGFEAINYSHIREARFG